MKTSHLSKREKVLVWISIILVFGLVAYSLVDYSISEYKNRTKNNNKSKYNNNVINYNKLIANLKDKSKTNIIIKCDCSLVEDYDSYDKAYCEQYYLSKNEATRLINKLGSTKKVKDMPTSTYCADYEFVFIGKDNKELIGGWTSDSGKSILVGYKNEGYAFDFDEDITKLFSSLIKGKEPYSYPSGDPVYIEKKPILYLYPKKDNTKITVSFKKPELLKTTYPKFKDKWEMTAKKNGDLTDKNGNYYYALYWEESNKVKVNFEEGYYVTKDNAIEFLEEKLKYIGLNDKERNEFIMYWLPILEKNKKSIVHFELTEERQKYNELEIKPTPDSLLRLNMHVKKVDKKPKKLEKQKLYNFKRKGFVAVEWGGTIHKK